MAIDFQDTKPLYLQIVEDIRLNVSADKLRVGDQLSSQAELAKQYGVSLITVKKALATLVTDGILFGRVGKGTYVARRSPLASPTTHRTIGLVLRDLQSPFFSLIAQSAEEGAYEAGYNVLLSNSSGQMEKEERQINHFRRIGVDGLIIASMSHIYHVTVTIRRLLRDKFPFVMVSYIEDEDMPFVGTDHEYGGYLATQHLIKMGFERIGYINGERGNLVGELRRKGYERALLEHGRSADERFIFRLRLRGEWNDFHSGYEIGQQFPSLAIRPDAMFVYNDLSALGFERALLEQGIRVPDEIAVVGFDDIEIGRYARVPLTTIRQPTDEIGRKALDYISSRIKGLEHPSRTILKPELVIRESSGTKR